MIILTNLLKNYLIHFFLRGSYFIFDCDNLLYCKCHKNFVDSCIGSHDWTKKKKATTNPKNDDDRCFQYAAIITLNHEKLESHQGRSLRGGGGGGEGLKPPFKY